MLNPEVIELLDDPDLGGGVVFTVKRTTRKRSLISTDTLTTDYLRGTGNIQPAQPDDIQLLPDENKHKKVIVIYSTFNFQLGEDGDAKHTEADVVLFDGHAWDVLQVNNWSKWGFHVAYATVREEALSQEDIDRCAGKVVTDNEDTTGLAEGE